MKKELIATVVQTWGIDKTIKVVVIAITSGIVGAGVSVLMIPNVSETNNTKGE